MSASKSKPVDFTCNCLSFPFYEQRRSLIMRNNPRDLSFSPDVVGIARQLVETTGWDIEDLIIQTLITNHPEVVDSVLKHDYFTGKSTIPFWFILPPESSNILEEYFMKYTDKIPQWVVVASLLRLGNTMLSSTSHD